MGISCSITLYVMYGYRNVSYASSLYYYYYYYFIHNFIFPYSLFFLFTCLYVCVVVRAYVRVLFDNLF